MTQKLILFDIDGTLVNSYPRYVAIMTKLLPLYEIEPTDEIFISTFPKTIDQTLIELNLPLNQKKTFLKKYFAIDQDLKMKEMLYPGMETVLTNIMKQPELKSGIVTSRDQTELGQLLKQQPILNSMDVIVSADSVPEHKPSPMPLKFAMDQLGIDAKNTIYIGDAKTDFQAAQAAQVKFAVAMWGTNEGSSFDSSTIKLNHPSEILQVIKN